MILDRDPNQLLIEDKRGQTPLEYVRPDQASHWIRFLEENKDRYFPVGGSLPPLTNVKEMRKDTKSLPDPPNALPVALAAAVSSGEVSVEQANQMDATQRARYQ